MQRANQDSDALVDQFHLSMADRAKNDSALPTDVMLKHDLRIVGRGSYALTGMLQSDMALCRIARC